MSARARDWADAQTVGDFTLKAILKELGNLADDAGMLFRSQSTLADRLECCAKTVRRALQVLETKGFIRREVRERRDGSRSSDRIFLAIPEAFATDAAVSPRSGPKVPGVGTESPQGRDPQSPLTSFESLPESTIESFSGPDGPAPLGGAEAKGFRKDLFERGVGTIRRLTGRSEAKSRALIGSWLKIVDDEAAIVLAVIDEAEEGELAEPTAWIGAQLRAAARRAGLGTQKHRRSSTNGALNIYADMLGIPDEGEPGFEELKDKLFGRPPRQADAVRQPVDVTPPRRAPGKRPSNHGALSLLAIRMQDRAERESGLAREARRRSPPNAVMAAYLRQAEDAVGKGDVPEVDRDARNIEALRMAEGGKWPRGGRVFVERDSAEGRAWEDHFARFGTRPNWVPLDAGVGWNMPTRWPPAAETTHGA